VYQPAMLERFCGLRDSKLVVKSEGVIGDIAMKRYVVNSNKLINVMPTKWELIAKRA